VGYEGAMSDKCPIPEKLVTPERLVRVEAPHFVAGLVFQRGKCVEAAPILRWAVGKRWPWFKGYCFGKDWQLLVLDPTTGKWRPPL
jgi:hypothetical protein